MYAQCGVEMLQVLPGFCMPTSVFPVFFLFFSLLHSYARPFPSLYARANIIMCLFFSLPCPVIKTCFCNTSVIQSITKSFRKSDNFPSYVLLVIVKRFYLCIPIERDGTSDSV